jgi:predicted metalloendopeptidase
VTSQPKRRDGRAPLLAFALVFITVTALFITSTIRAARAEGTQRILFIGNSYTYFNNLPSILEQMANESRPNALETKMVVDGGATLKDLWDGGEALKAIRQGGWSYVVLQEQSTLGDGPTEKGVPQISDPSNFYDYSRRFDAEIKKVGAKTAFFLTWSRQDSPQNQPKLTMAYSTIAKELTDTLVPVGPVWETAIHEKPDLALHQIDKAHPTPAGTYLTACVFYSVLFSRNPSGLPARFLGIPVDMEGHIFNAESHGLLSSPRDAELISLSSQDAHFLQTVAWTATQSTFIPATRAQLQSGLETPYVDRSVRPQDDFYRYVNGKWLVTAEIPADRSAWGSYATLRDTVQGQLRGLIEGSGKDAGASANERKIADLYASFMDESRLETLALTPLQPDLAKVDLLTDKREIPALVAYLNRIGATAPYATYVSQDARDASRYTVVLYQSGLGLPDRDYYLKDDARLKDTRTKYLAHVETMLTLIGDRSAPRDAKDILTLETEIAKAQWTKVDNRDPVKTYNKLALSNLDVLIRGYDWKAYLSAAGIENRVDSVIVSQPSYIQDLAELLENTPLRVWKAYFKWALVNNAAPYLSKVFVDTDFAFYGTVLRGVPQNLPRWKRGVSLVNESIGEGVGQLYVAKYFPPSSKARAEELVGNLLSTYHVRINTLDWMGPETKEQAQAKLAKIKTKIGYPDKWRDYSPLRFSRSDLLGNVTRANEFEYQRNLNKLGGPVDRQEWDMTPQTVNAYYNPQMNEIVFPAAELQPPDFQPDADDAANYGGIGATIGHEISHGFDDQGSQFDADGNLRNWWTKEDHEAFAAKTATLVAEYGAFEPIPGFHLNGELTLGENIADNSGLTIAYLAYRSTLAGRDAPVIEGLTGDQRFFIAFAQSRRLKIRPEQALVYLKSDPHSPAEFRVQGAVVNQPGFYAAFGVKEGDRMYLAPEKRATIW